MQCKVDLDEKSIPSPQEKKIDFELRNKLPPKHKI
jgi:hypothetical protein